MLGDKAVLTVMAGRTVQTVTITADRAGYEVSLDASVPGIVSAVVHDRKGSERARAVVGIANLVAARTEFRK